MLPRKSLPMASVAAHPGGSPMPPARRCPSKGTRMPLPPMQGVPYPGARPPVSARRGALKPSSEHVALKKRASGQRRGSPRGLTHASRPTLFSNNQVLYIVGISYCLVCAL